MKKCIKTAKKIVALLDKSALNPEEVSAAIDIATTLLRARREPARFNKPNEQKTA